MCNLSLIISEEYISSDGWFSIIVKVVGKFMESISTRGGNFEAVFSWSFQVVQTFFGKLKIGWILWSQVSSSSTCWLSNKMTVIQCPCCFAGMWNFGRIRRNVLQQQRMPGLHFIPIKVGSISTSIDNIAPPNKMFRKERPILNCAFWTPLSLKAVSSGPLGTGAPWSVRISCGYLGGPLGPALLGGSLGP